MVAPGRADSWSKEKKLRELLDGQKRCEGHCYGCRRACRLVLGGALKFARKLLDLQKRCGGHVVRKLIACGYPAILWVPLYVPPGAGGL